MPNETHLSSTFSSLGRALLFLPLQVVDPMAAISGDVTGYVYQLKTNTQIYRYINAKVRALKSVRPSKINTIVTSGGSDADGGGGGCANHLRSENTHKELLVGRFIFGLTCCWEKEGNNL